MSEETMHGLFFIFLDQSWVYTAYTFLFYFYFSGKNTATRLDRAFSWGTNKLGVTWVLGDKNGM